MRIIIIAAAATLSSCATTPTLGPQEQFFASLSSFCGQTLEGRLVSDDPQDADMTDKPMTANFSACNAREVRINFAVGDDTSRNWVISRLPGGLRLKHVHLHVDGAEDKLSRYGGDTVTRGTPQRQEFPADPFSKALFERLDYKASVANIWALEARDGHYAYELRRPGRFFRVEFRRVK